ncbi:response regulator [Desulfococcaceae bacterium HSG7]|nr:response regulator [Desulfococcaceae bacterium HSG7]
MNKTILLADDEEDIRDVLSIYLSDMGYSVITAEDGLQALDIFQKEKPAIVLSDIKMPVMDGIELLKQIKKRDPHTEVIMITGHGDMDLAIKSLKLDACDFITKPINDDAFEIALKRACDKIELREQIRVHNENLHRLVQEELHATRRQHRQLFNEAPCYISVQNSELKITDANERFKQDFGDKRGAFCYEIYKHRNEPCLDCPVQKTFDDGLSHQYETVVSPKKNHPYNVLVQTSPIKNEKGEITHVMEMSTNITQVRKLQDQLSSLGLLIGSISHSIKGILTGMDGGLYLLDSGLRTRNYDRIHNGNETVKLMAGRIRKMVLDVLYYAKERQLQLTQINTAEFALDVASAVKTKMKQAGVRFKTDFGSTSQVITIDTAQMRPALINILENAVDACVEDCSKDAHEIIFSVKQNNQSAIFSIKDNGMGMNRETCENMFTLFFSSKGHKGTGLGLFISNRIIEQHGGTIIIESAPTEGSLFTIRIPS